MPISRLSFWLSMLALLLAAVGWLYADPWLDMHISGLFYTSATQFAARGMALFNGFSYLVQWGSRLWGLWLAGALLLALWRRQKIAGLGARELLFLLMTLILLPGILTNTVLKDHWGRARPYQITEFGGSKHYTPPFLMANQCAVNCSFVSGDAAVGFYFHTLGYVAAAAGARRRRFWGGLGFGAIAGLNRIVMGAHFLSDVLLAGVFMLAGAALLHALFFGRTATRECWRDFLGGPAV